MANKNKIYFELRQSLVELMQKMHADYGIVGVLSLAGIAVGVFGLSFVFMFLAWLGLVFGASDFVGWTGGAGIVALVLTFVSAGVFTVMAVWLLAERIKRIKQTRDRGVDDFIDY